MDSTTSSSRRRGRQSCEESCNNGAHWPPPQSARCFCLYLALSVVFFVLVVAVLLVVFVTRLKKPTFLLQSVQMDRSFSMIRSLSSSLATAAANGTGGGELNGTACSVASLVFAAQNANGIGIRYGAAELGVAYANESVGGVGVPEFYQPPRSANVTVPVHAVFSQSDVSRLVVGELSAQRKYMEIRIAGSIVARTHIMNFPLPKIQFSIDCRIGTNYTDIVLREGIESVITRKALLVSELPHVSQKCSIKIDLRSRGKRASLDELGC
uniref:Late embryogenesis abundant protein LEA-2 subgroup domain-containing protein n=1 Tax=Oryza punctata TaxID=4537 RepID=A0A0E0M1L4_ORYPU